MTFTCKLVLYIGIYIRKYIELTTGLTLKGRNGGDNGTFLVCNIFAWFSGHVENSTAYDTLESTEAARNMAEFLNILSSKMRYGEI